MAMQFYASPEQIMRDRAELARKGIARGRSAVVLSYEGGVLFVAENLSSALHKVSEIYDRIGFAAVGRYNEFENLRRGGVRMADLNGFSYDRRDVTGRALANAYTQLLGAIFTEQQKPYEVEICIAEVGAAPERDELYRITYDGSVTDEPGYLAMGGQSEAIAGALRSRHSAQAPLVDALKLAVQALGSIGGENGAARQIAADQLEVAVLDRRRPGRAFRRITGSALRALLDEQPGAEEAAAEEPGAGDPTRPATPTSAAPSEDRQTAADEAPSGKAAPEPGTAPKPEPGTAPKPEPGTGGGAAPKKKPGSAGKEPTA